MINRDVAETAVEYDVIVVGGGVYGVAIALEACLRGLRPLVLESDDFGQHTSANTLRILHGGLRYLQSLDLIRFRGSVVDRRWWLQSYPELVTPLPCLMPLYGEGLRRRTVIRLALLANDILSFNRNRGVRDDRLLPRSRILERRGVFELFPAARSAGLAGGALWHDASMESPPRLLLEMLRWVAQEGGAALNYTEVREVVSIDGRVQSVCTTDRIGNSDREFRAPVVVNAAGPWSRAVVQKAPGARDVPSLFQPSLAFNLLLDRPLPSEAPVAVHSPGGRSPIYFLRPYGPFTFAGTMHVSWSDGPQRPTRTPEKVIADFVAELRTAIPGWEVSEADVLRDFPGLLPAGGPGTEVTAKRPVIIDHGRRGGPCGLISVSGVKFTTAPGVARAVLDLISPKVPRGTRHAFLERRPPVRAIPNYSDFESLRERSPESARSLIQTLLREEAVTCAEDLVLRRLDWGLQVRDPEAVARDLGLLAVPRPGKAR